MSKLFNELSKLNNIDNKVTFVPANSKNDSPLADEKKQYEAEQEDKHQEINPMEDDITEIGINISPAADQPDENGSSLSAEINNSTENNTFDEPQEIIMNETLTPPSDDKNENNKDNAGLTDSMQSVPDTTETHGTIGSPEKSIFSKRNIIIGLVIILLVCFKLFTNDSKEQSKDIKKIAAKQESQITPANNAISQESSASSDSSTGTQEAVPEKPTIKEEVNTFLNNWKDAWVNSAGANGDIEKYMSFYSKEFKAGPMNFSKWQSHKGRINKKKEWIEVFFSDILIDFQEEKEIVELSFYQEYASSNFTEKSTKFLTLQKEGDAWKIIKED